MLSRYVDGIMARTFDHADVTGLAEHGSVPVINGLTDLLHPCQALADLMTMTEVLGGLAGKTLAYIGDGNNMAHSLMFAASKAGMHFVCVSPQGYAMEPALLARIARELARARTIKLEDPPTPFKTSRILEQCGDVEVRIFGGLGGVFLLEELMAGATGAMTGAL